MSPNKVKLRGYEFEECVDWEAIIAAMREE